MPEPEIHDTNPPIPPIPQLSSTAAAPIEAPVEPALPAPVEHAGAVGTALSSNGHTIPAPIEPPAPPIHIPVPRALQKAPASNDPISRFRNKTTVDEDARMGFIDHLLELRKRLWISIIAVVLCVVLALVFYKQVYNFLLEPIRAVDRKYVGILTTQGFAPATGHVIDITTTQPLGSMMMVVWLGFWAGLVIASPIIMYELWAFVAPGLHDKEKNAIKPVLYGGVFFFLAGAAAAYYLLAPVSFDFFLWLDIDLKIKPNWTSESCIEMLITMMIVSGLLMEIPLLVAGMARLGVLEPAWLIKYWKVLTFGSVLLGMVVSPGNDLASMAAFSGLILGIYIISIVMAYIFYRKPADPYDTVKKNGAQAA